MSKGPVKTSAQATANWVAGMQSGNAVTKYKQGIQNYNGNPMALAASDDAQARYRQNTADASSSGRIASRLNSVDPGFWKSQATTVGANNLANGVKKGQPKYQKMADKLAGVWATQRSVVSGMPKGGRSNAKARSAAALDVMMDAFGKS